jgi:hypothetical protein
MTKFFRELSAKRPRSEEINLSFAERAFKSIVLCDVYEECISLKIFFAFLKKKLSSMSTSQQKPAAKAAS